MARKKSISRSKPRRTAKATPTAAPLAELLAPLRRKIDALDDQIIDRLNQRARLAQQIGAHKARAAQPMYVPERERAVLDRLVERSAGPLPETGLRLIYKEIISASLALESPLRVAFLGPEANLAHAAAKQHFGLSAQLVPCESLGQVLLDAERSRCDYGVVPIESSAHGVEHPTLDVLAQTDLLICSEVFMRAGHHLLSVSGERDPIPHLYATAEALAACRAWLDAHLPGVPTRTAVSTAHAAHMARQEDAAILAESDVAAALYGLRVAARHLDSAAGHTSRFLVVGHQEAAPTGRDRTSVVFAMRDAPGILYRALQPFARHKLNMTRIESRPSRRRFADTLFFVDVDGHRAAPKLANALRQLAETCVYVRVLGSYPQGTPPGRATARASFTKEL